MAINMDTLCIQCLLNKHVETVRDLDAEKAIPFTRDLLEILAEKLNKTSSAVAAARINQLYQKHFGLGEELFAQEKMESNQFVKARLESISQLVEQQPDPVFAGLQFSILGNYLDFSALKGQISFEKLDQMLQQALQMQLDMQTYESLCHDLQTGKQLLYITDNAGEIGFDRIFAQQLQKKYPHLQITFCVRGLPAHNDATREDAAFMEIPFKIIDTGNDIGGVDIPSLSPEAKQALENADVVIAKGMGNTESMYGCGYRVYYAFLVKCPRFVEFFNKPHMTPMLLKENAK